MLIEADRRTQEFADGVTNSIHQFMVGHFSLDLPTQLRLLPNRDFRAVKARSYTLPRSMTFYPDQNLVWEENKDGSIIYAQRDDYDLCEELKLAQRIFESGITGWTTVVKLDSVPKPLAKHLLEISGDERRQVADSLLPVWNGATDEPVGIPNRLYRRWIDKPDHYFISGATTWLTIEFNGDVNRVASLGDDFDLMVATNIVRPYLVEEFRKIHTHKSISQLDWIKPIGKLEVPFTGSIVGLSAQDRWIRRVIAGLGFELTTIGLQIITREYFLGGIGQAILKELEQPRGVLTLEDYLNPPIQK